jgi:hypothetical protein
VPPELEVLPELDVELEPELLPELEVLLEVVDVEPEIELELELELEPLFELEAVVPVVPPELEVLLVLIELVDPLELLLLVLELMLVDVDWPLVPPELPSGPAVEVGHAVMSEVISTPATANRTEFVACFASTRLAFMRSSPCAQMKDRKKALRRSHRSHSIER